MTISGPSGIYLQLSDGFNGRYALGAEDLSGRIPDNLSLAIPGAEFPAMSDAKFPPNVEPLDWVEPIPMTTITQDTMYKWVPSTNENAIITIRGNTGDREGKETLWFTCRVKDDGEFTLPADALLRLDGDFVSDHSSVGHRVTSYHIKGSAVMEIMHNITLTLQLR